MTSLLEGASSWSPAAPTSARASRGSTPRSTRPAAASTTPSSTTPTASVERATGAAAALRRPHRRRDRRRHRVGQVLDVQRAHRARPRRRRRPPADHVVGDRVRVGHRRRRRAARLARHPARGTRSSATRCSTPGREDQRARGRRAARPARPRLDRGLPPPRGRPAGRARRPAGVGARPAEVRRRRDPRPLPRAAGDHTRRDAGRAQPHRHRARRRGARRCSPTSRRLLDADGLADVPVLADRAPATASASPSSRERDRPPGRARRRRTRARLEADLRGRRRTARRGDRRRRAAPGAIAGSGSRRSRTPSPRPPACRPSSTPSSGRPGCGANRATGWPVTAWLSRLEPDPLKRLHLDLGAAGKQLAGAARTSVPEADAGAAGPGRHRGPRARRRRLGRASARPWADAVRRAVDRRGSTTSATGSTRRSAPPTSAPRGCPAGPALVRVLQWLLILAAVGGGVWLGVLAVDGLPPAPTPRPRGSRASRCRRCCWSAGSLLGVLLALVCRLLVGGDRPRAGAARPTGGCAAAIARGLRRAGASQPDRGRARGVRRRCAPGSTQRARRGSHRLRRCTTWPSTAPRRRCRRPQAPRCRPVPVAVGRRLAVWSRAPATRSPRRTEETAR